MGVYLWHNWVHDVPFKRLAAAGFQLKLVKQTPLNCNLNIGSSAISGNVFYWNCSFVKAAVKLKQISRHEKKKRKEKNIATCNVLIREESSHNKLLIVTVATRRKRVRTSKKGQIYLKYYVLWVFLLLFRAQLWDL